MARELYVFDQPERFVAGTVGQPGERQFFLQARDGRRIVSVALEKQQVLLLAERLDALLDQVLRRSGGDPGIPAAAPVEVEDTEPLDTPISEEFEVGSLSFGWNEETKLVIVETHAMVEDDEEIPDLEEDPVDGPATLRVRITAAYARGFVKRAKTVVSAGRPPCPFCALPLEPSGHICPRANGYRR
jgi:uncharacterized repeat protein (TIGR03847 family)